MSKTTISITRVAILMATGCAAGMLLLASPADNATAAEFYCTITVSKLLAAICCIAFHSLYTRWKRIDRWVGLYARECRRVEAAKNPMMND